MSSFKKIIFRFTIILLVAGIQLLYFPLNQTSSGGVAPAIPLDAHIPLLPGWVFIYLAAIPAWVFALVWSTFKMDDLLFRLSALTAVTAVCVGVSMFHFFPTYVVRPEIHRSDLSSIVLGWLYAHDQPYNALPSAHVYLTAMIALLWSRWKPKWSFLWLTAAVAICLSTLFTKQHYLLDVITGMGVAIAAYCLGIGLNAWLEKRKSSG